MVGISLFSLKFGKGALGDGIEYWKCFYQSLRPTQMGLSLNIIPNKDITRPLTDQERLKVKRALWGVRAEVRH
ncbi:hypothetical protein L1987_20046 [Smallanthus sonchifolius]|uniref:Uncharacterized protein n=1 Tax=Smallanthus sonchifolius TaxID=185202 RepID=A0ACB9IQZ0_9ASTR|nr:hypothetical protein L1987_20046 [Smallanthus sonchifolius]